MKKMHKLSDKNLLILLISVVTIIFIFIMYFVSRQNVKNVYAISAISVDDPESQTVKLVLKTLNNEDTVINTENYLWHNDTKETTKGAFYNFIVSPDSKYLFYTGLTPVDSSNFFLFDISKKTNNYLDFDINHQAFTNNSKYFYACGNESIIYRLPDLKVIYRSTKKGTFFTCTPSLDTNKIIFSEYQNKQDQNPSAIYQLSALTGNFKQIK